MKNIFTDFHHAGLLQSLILLFEKRLGGMVFRPIGMEWANQGFWKVYDHPATQAQFLAVGGATPDGTPPLNDTEGRPPVAGVYWCRDIDSDSVNCGITFDAFIRMPFDIVIASLPQHIEPYRRLCELHPNKPKLVYQIGNQWNVPEGLIVKNVMSSARVTNVPTNINYVQYHQEFDTNIFKPLNTEKPWAFYQDDNIDLALDPPPHVFSFVNVFQNFPDWQLFEEVEKLMPYWRFASFGGQCRDGAAHGNRQVAKRMREARFVWHTKAGGDGYGHIIHNVPAVGRPLIVKKEYYAGKMAEPLLVDGETCVTIDGLSTHAIVEKINHYSVPDRYAKMCKNAYENFKKVVDFDREEQEIRKFLERLI